MIKLSQKQYKFNHFRDFLRKFEMFISSGGMIINKNSHWKDLFNNIILDHEFEELTSDLENKWDISKCSTKVNKDVGQLSMSENMELVILFFILVLAPVFLLLPIEWCLHLWHYRTQNEVIRSISLILFNDFCKKIICYQSK